MVALKVEGPELLQRRKRALLKPSELVVGEVKPREGREVRKGVVSDGAGDLVPAQREGPQARHARKGALRNRLDSTVGQVEVGAGCRALACAREPVPVFFEPEGAAAAHLKLHPRRRRVRTRVHRCVCLYNTQTVRRVHPRAHCPAKHFASHTPLLHVEYVQKPSTHLSWDTEPHAHETSVHPRYRQSASDSQA